MPLLARPALLLWPLLALLGPSAAGLSKVRCSRPVCPKGQRAIRRQGAARVWAFGCNATQSQSVLNSCCLEKEICMRTCGMEWAKCSEIFGKCAVKVCGEDDSCIDAAEAADSLISGGDNHMAVCKAFRDNQHELCTCLPFKEAKEGASARLASFYAAFKPERLDESGNVRGVEEVWKKWQGREPELFFELTRKYSSEALDLRVRPDEELARLRAEEEAERRRVEEEELAIRRAEEERLQRRQAEEMARLQAMQEELLRKQAEEQERRRKAEEEELNRRKAEEELARRRAEVTRLRAEKADAIAQEDYMQAKALKAQLASLDPEGEL